MESKGRKIIKIQINGEEKYREAALSIKFSKISIPSPPNRTVNKDGAHLPHIQLWGIMAQEKNPPDNMEELQWLLLTNIPIENLEQAVEKTEWYSLRWNVELFHKILKSGCSIEKSQLRSGEKLKKYITVKSIIAWRLFWLTRSFRVNNEATCENYLSTAEWKLLSRRFNNGKEARQPPSAKEVYYWIAKLGGYIGRRTDPPPGMISIWKGWSRYMEMVKDYGILCG